MRVTQTRLAAIVMLFILCSSAVFSISVSPTELRIKNTDPKKNYQFIVLISSDDEGLVDIELKSSEKALSISPDKFMLNQDEKKSVRIGFIAGNIDANKDKILVQPYVNNMPSENKLIIYLEKNNETIITPEIQEERKSIITIIKEPEILRLLIYGLMLIVALLIILIFMPEIKKSLKKAKHELKVQKDHGRNIRIRNRVDKAERRLDEAQKKIKEITLKVERFYEHANDWLKKNSDGKYEFE